MKKLALVLLLLLPATLEAKPILRHVEGLKGLEINLGTQELGAFAEVNGAFYIGSDWLVKIGLGGAKRLKQEHGNYNAIFSQPALVYTLWDNYKNLFFNALIGPYLAYEKINDLDRRFNIAIALGAEAEFFLVHRLELLAGGGMRHFFLNKEAGIWGYFISAGLRFTF